MELTNSSKLYFKEFYQEIRSHFSNARDEYDDFKAAATLEDKLRYLLEHQKVKDQLDRLKMCCGKSAEKMCQEKSNWKTQALKSSKTQLSFLNPKKNCQLPQLSPKAKLCRSNKSGRRIVAKEKISPGEIIIREKPYATVMYPQYQSTHCLTCFKFIEADKRIKNPLCEKVTFCSDLCMNLAMTNFHWAECSYLDMLQGDSELGVMALLVYRTVVEAGLENVVNINRKENQENVVYDSDNYAAVALQVTHESKRDAGEHFRRLLTSLYLCHFLNMAGFFQTDVGDFFTPANADLVAVACQMSRHLMSCSCNAYEIGEMVRSEWEGQVSHELGGAIYPTVSLTNHSCSPNTMRYSDGILCVMRASRTINPGEEIFDNYGTFYQINGREERCQRLRKQYFFDCECPACKYDWPMVDTLRKQPIVICCLSCGSVIDEKKKKCPKCKRDLKNIPKLAKTLASLDETTMKAVKAINKENHQTYLQHFVAVLLELEKHVREPSWQRTLCRQALNQCFTVTGNYRIEDD